MQIQGMMQVSPAGNGNTPGTQGGLSAFERLAPGQSTQAQVVEVSEGKLTLKTATGDLVQADFPKDSGIVPGDILELTLVTKGEGQTQLRLTAINGQTVNLEANEMQVYLMNLGVQPSESNTKAAQFLLDRNVFPTAEKINTLLKIAEQFPQLEAAVAFFMAENEVPVTKQNVETLQRWFSQPQAIGDTAQELSGILEQMITSGHTVEGKPDFTEAFLNRISTQEGRTVTKNIAPEALSALAQQLSGLEEGQAMAAIQKFAAAAQLPQEQKAALTAFVIGAYDAVKNTQAENGTQTPASEAMPQEQPGAQGGQIAQASEQPTGRMDGQVQGNAAGREMAATGQGVGTVPLQEPPVQIQSGNGQAVQEAKQMIQALEKFFAPVRQDAENAAVLQQALKGQQALAENVREGAARLTGEAGYLTQKAGEMSSQIKIGAELNQFYYCQIPFETGGNKNTAELYVFERNREKQKGDRTRMTVLIALETQYMGRVESVLRTESGELTVELRVENERVERFLQEAAEELSSELKGSDFKIGGISVCRIKTPVTPLNATQALGEETPAARVEGIDIRI